MEKILHKIIVPLLAAAPLLAGAAGNNWMSSLSDSMAISQFSIPGTHDSGALYEPVLGTAKCQNLSIGDQLNVGVRFLDIRCRHINNTFAIHHGQVYQNMNFDDVLNATLGFLNSNPSETVIMSVKEEYDATGNTRSFEQTFDAYVAKNPSRWYLGSTIPTLSVAKGKIVLLRRFGAGTPKGIDASNWGDNTTFSSGVIRVQDWYNVSNNDTKWGYINALFNEANGGSPSTLYINFASGVGSILFIPNIPMVATNINPRLTSFFTANPSGHFGIIPMDFADAAKCALIYNTVSAAPGVISGGTYGLKARHSGKFLDAYGALTANDTKLAQSTWNDGSNLKWIVNNVGARQYTLIGVQSGRAVDVANATTADVQLRLWDANNSVAQKWVVTATDSGYYKLVNVNSGKAMDVYGISTAEGAAVYQSTWNGGANQQWAFQGAGITSGGTYGLKARHSGKFLDAYYALTANGTLLAQSTWNGGNNQKWVANNVGGNQYTFIGVQSGRAVDVANATTADVQLRLWDANGSVAQKWVVTATDSGYYKLVNVNSGKAMDVYGLSTADGAAVYQATWNGGNNQQWLFQAQ